MVPALNEELNLRNAIQSIVSAAKINTEELYIIIVNDGSTALRVSNIFDACVTFLKLLIEIKITKRRVFNQSITKEYRK